MITHPEGFQKSLRTFHLTKFKEAEIMKKAFAAAIVFLIAAVVFIPVCFAGVSKGAEEVSYNEETLSGDVSYAQGLEIELAAESAGCLFWDIAVTVSETPEAEAQFDFDSGFYGYSAYSYDSVLPDMYFYFSFLYEGAMSSDAITADDLNAEGLAGKAIEAVAENTENGETYTQEIRLADYYDYFPVYAEGSLYDPDITGETTSYFDSGQLSALLTEYFAVPVPDDCYVEISVTKDEDGNITGADIWRCVDLTAGYSLTDEGEYSYVNGPFTRSVYTQEGIFFTLSAYSDGLYDLSGSCGYGIWLLEFETDEDSSALTAESISLVYEIDPEECEVLNISASDDGSELFLAAIEEDYITITVIDAAGFTEKQKIYAAPAGNFEDEQDYAAAMTSGSSCLVFQCAEGFITLYYDEAAGEYASMFSPMSEDEYVLLFNSLDLIDFMYDDGKLDIVISQFPDENSTGFILAVCDEEGLEYAGLYTSSIDTGDTSGDSMIFDISFSAD